MISKVELRSIVTPKIDFKNKLIEIQTEFITDVFGEKQTQFYRKIIELEDQATRSALISLGWSPPLENYL